VVVPDSPASRTNSVSGITLSDGDKERIRAEEIFRHEVAQSLDRRSGVTRFFNSPFGLWVLSSIFLAGLLSGIQWFSKSVEQRSKDQRLREDLTYEINRHCGEFVGAIKKADNYDGYSRAYDNHLKRLAQCHLSLFKDATMDQLLWELHSLPGTADKQVAREVTDTIYNTIWPAIWELSWQPDFPPNSLAKQKFDAWLYNVLHVEITDKMQNRAASR
jgi:hypothetical protein